MKKIAAAIALFFVLLLFAPHARAQDRQFGGCWKGGAWCAGPAVAISVGQLNLSTSKFSGGIIPGVGYGVTYGQGQWYASGAALYLAFQVGQGVPTTATPSLLFSFANYVRAGAGVSLSETSGPVRADWLLLFGMGADVGAVSTAPR